MIPDRLSFLSEFDNFYQALVRDLKENKYNKTIENNRGSCNIARPMPY